MMFDIVNVEAPDPGDLIMLSPNDAPGTFTGIYDRVKDTMYLPLPDKISTLVIGLSNYMRCDLRVIFSSKVPIDLEEFERNGIEITSAIEEFGMIALVSYPSMQNFFHNIRENDLLCTALIRLEQQIEMDNSQQVNILSQIPVEDKTDA